jgi:predicted enzyme related to lactoylglutathione lyase
MHRSRLATIVIDCAEDDFESGANFWSAALGKALVRQPHGNDRFASLQGRIAGEGGLYAGLQRVPKEERAIHLDIETDDVQAEVTRLEKLGARIKARIRNHVVMVAPSGHAFCVVPVQRGDFPKGATEWP